ncbi:MAG: hypothetical protein IJW03_02340 [Clostridia bacterium]|nr:hypothetical protein [Clostridia bacterium]
MKKILTLLLATIMIIAVSFAFSSCSETGVCDGSEVGNGGSQIKKIPATCLGLGYIEYKCDKGGDSHIVIIPETGHTASDWIIDVEPTCTETGLKHNVCINCKEVIETDVVIPANGHSYVWTTTIEPACTTVGAKNGKCTVCEDEELGVAIDALGHSWGAELTTPANCVEDGRKYKECSRCDEETVTAKLTAIGHTVVDDEWVVVEPKCKEDGCKYQVCKVCKEDKLNLEVLPQLDHEVEMITDKPATCIETGLEHGECIRCDYKTENKELPIVSHSREGDWIVDYAATCTDAGLKHYVCTVCKEAQNETIAAIGHSWSEYIDNATCIADGERYDVCANCSGTKNHMPLTATGHDIDEESGICNNCDKQQYKVVIKYRLPDGSFVDEYEKHVFAVDGDINSVSIPYVAISGYYATGTTFGNIYGYTIEIIVNYAKAE